jgi:hypothetical protein
MLRAVSKSRTVSPRLDLLEALGPLLLIGLFMPILPYRLALTIASLSYYKSEIKGMLLKGK